MATYLSHINQLRSSDILQKEAVSSAHEVPERQDVDPNKQLELADVVRAPVQINSPNRTLQNVTRNRRFLRRMGITGRLKSQLHGKELQRNEINIYVGPLVNADHHDGCTIMLIIKIRKFI